MNSSQIIFWLATLVSFIAMVAIIVRAGGRPVQNEISSGGSLAGVVALWLTAAAAGFILVLKRLVVAVYLFLLLIGHRAAGGAKVSIHKIENRFLRLIEAVRGRGQRTSPEERHGAVSFFLEQIKVDKVETRRRANRRLISPP